MLPHHSVDDCCSSQTLQSPLGTLKLANFASCVYQDCDRRPFAFTMQPKAANGRSYFFAAETYLSDVVHPTDHSHRLTDQKRWLHAIDDHIPGRRTLSQKWSLLQDLIGQLMQKGATKEGIFRYNLLISVSRYSVLHQDSWQRRASEEVYPSLRYNHPRRP